jgi:hypothetical protein
MIVSDGSFRSTDTDCAYRIWKPCNPSGRTHPCVVMANGFSLTIEDGLPAFAQRFAAGGLLSSLSISAISVPAAAVRAKWSTTLVSALISLRRCPSRDNSTR